ncbi:MAG: response regulator [Thermodesulfobacteriota bacterium]|nr:response regulator [Thermodesulfobacteriota bacterium]
MAKKILIIDDEQSSTSLLAFSLKSDGYEVFTADRGEQGLKIFDRELPDIVITDIRMPGIDGIEVLRRIKEQAHPAEVIIVTGHGDIDNAIECLKYGASDFINKPVRAENLSVALERAEKKLELQAKLDEYTENLEQEVETVTHELRMQSKFLEKLIQTSEEGIVATDQIFTVIIYNPAAEHILGYPAEDVLHRKKAKDLFSLDLMRKYKAKRHDHQKGKKLDHFETHVKNSNGELIPVRFTGVFLYEHGKIMGSVAFLQDLREIKRLEKELLMSERLATVGQTVAGMAHGVKNILHGFKGGKYLMEVGFKNSDTEKLKAGWQIIKNNIDHTSELVMDLLTYSNTRDVEYVLCEPNDIVRDVCQAYEEITTENDIEMTVDLDEAIGRVAMDKTAIHTILMNLVSNAVDACIFDDIPGKTYYVTVKTKLEKNSMIRFDVIDNGTGMEKCVQDKMFTSFFSTKGDKGTGLGLLVTRKLIEDHNGTIDVVSELEKGTQFVIKIPFQASDNVT